jgi:hypothetical protein
MRRVNILADKSLLAAFVENTHAIETRHVQAAIRDSEMTPARPWLGRKTLAVAGGLTLFAAILVGAGWFIGHEQITPSSTGAGTDAIVASRQDPVTTIAPSPSTTAPLPTATLGPGPGRPSFDEEAFAHAMASVPKHSLLRKRLDAMRDALGSAPKGSASIQLYYTENTQPERMEGFLMRAKKLGKLEEIYIQPFKLEGKAAYRALYGIYANNVAASAGISQLPPRYQEAFAPTLYLLDDARSMP